MLKKILHNFEILELQKVSFFLMKIFVMFTPVYYYKYDNYFIEKNFEYNSNTDKARE